MAMQTLYGKANLCYTEADDFTNVQPVGKDPIYMRYDSVYSVIDKHFSEEYKHFLAHPLYSEDDGYIQWYVKEWKETPRKFIELSGIEKQKYAAIRDRYISEYNNVRSRLTGEDLIILTNAMKYIDDDFLFCYDDKVVVIAWGMMPDKRKHVIKGSVIHNLKIQEKHKLRFIVSGNARLLNKVDEIIYREDGAVMTERDLPEVVVDEGYEFRGWTPDPLRMQIKSDMDFTAVIEQVHITMISVDFACDDFATLSGATHFEIRKGDNLSQCVLPAVIPYEGYEFKGWSVDTSSAFHEDTIIKACVERKMISCRFDTGMHGVTDAANVVKIPYGQQFSAVDLPQVTPDKGFRFVGWNGPQGDYVLMNDITVTAMYEEKLPWYKRLWAWLLRAKWLWWLLLLLLLLLLLWLLKDCSCSSKHKKVSRASSDVVIGNSGTPDVTGTLGTGVTTRTPGTSEPPRTVIGNGTSRTTVTTGTTGAAETPIVLSNGDVQILLSWENYNDLDLMCTDPNGEMIWYENKRSTSGGQLEVDMNVNYPGSSMPVEHIFWPVGGAPQGTYNVYVKYYRHHSGNVVTPFTVEVKSNSQTEVYHGTVRSERDVVPVCSFTVGQPSSATTCAVHLSDNDDIERLQQEKARLQNELNRVNDEIDRIKNTRKKNR